MFPLLTLQIVSFPMLSDHCSILQLPAHNLPLPPPLRLDRDLAHGPVFLQRMPSILIREAGLLEWTLLMSYFFYLDEGYPCLQVVVITRC